MRDLLGFKWISKYSMVLWHFVIFLIISLQIFYSGKADPICHIFLSLLYWLIISANLPKCGKLVNCSGLQCEKSSQFPIGYHAQMQIVVVNVRTTNSILILFKMTLGSNLFTPCLQYQ